MNTRREIDNRLSVALAKLTGIPEAPALAGPASNPKFGDYQANGVMSAAKRLKTNPRKLAEELIATVDLSDLAEKVEVAGPGFINITLKKDFLQDKIAENLKDDRLGVPPASRSERIVIDYSSPNLAKEMHVGHLRSTIIGDALVRLLDFLGHNVIRQNHVGDWGTQFGMLVAYLDKLQKDLPPEQTDLKNSDAPRNSLFIEDLEEYYRQAKQLFDTDENFANLARQCVVKLQSGNPETLQSWQRFKNLSWQHCRKIYEKLGVLLTEQDIRGESAYNDDLPEVIKALEEKGLLTESQGAKCIFLDELKDKDGNALPVIVQKSDGGYLYATTDLAAIRYRVEKLKADRILYVTDSRQSLHFQQVFAVARKAGFASEGVRLEHIAFGMMLSPDGKPFKTREGGTVKLMDLLDEAEQRAYKLVREKSPHLPEDEKRKIAHVVGIGAVKYADLSQHRLSDYVFDLDKMLSLEGNTAPYMQYAYARIRSIFRKNKSDKNDEQITDSIVIEHPAERTLVLKLLQFAEAIESATSDYFPHLLCNYLYDLAGAFTTFYESCPVLKSSEPIRSSRLQLCQLTARTLRTGLGLLGIGTVEQM